MAERYTRVFILPETDLYETGAPLLICAGALLKDTQTGRMIAQLKFRNIGIKPIAAVKVSVRAFDAFGTEVEGVPEFQYLDLSETRDREFGQKTPIMLPNAETRSFSCTCKSVIFADGSVWNAQTEDWQPLTKQQSLESRFGDLAAQYRRDTHFPSAKNAVAEDRDLWLCVCGAVNHAKETVCHVCKADREALKAAENPEQLKEHDEAYCRHLAEQAEAARLEKERKAEEVRKEAERKAEQKRIAAKKRKRIIAIIASIVVACIVFVIVLTKVIIPNQKYNAATELYNTGKYEEAIEAFTALDGYKDSAAQIEKCETAIKDEKYTAAVELYTAGKYEDAIAAFTALDGYKDSAVQKENAIKDKAYYAAVTLYNDGKFEDAIAAFTALDGYKDSAAQIKEIMPKYYKQLLSNASVGSMVFFGSYEQDNNTANGKENIEWIVLAKEGNKVLVISKYAIDCQKYSSIYTDVTWETCSLRKWLNETFLNAAFSSEEQNSIISSTVTADKNPSYSTSPGNNTTDKVFLLSITEVNKYFSSDEARKCAPTDYAIAQGAGTSVSIEPGGRFTCWWWLQSPGYNLSFRSYRAAYVNHDGSVYGYGRDVYYFSGAVRPALWIDIG